MGMITREAQQMQLLKKLEPVKDDETICLWGWEVKVLLGMISNVIRCKDCRKVELCCIRRTDNPEWFCGSGERKGND